jgi:hypothetical protein
MTHKSGNFLKQISASTGLTTLLLSGTPVHPYRRFSSVLVEGNTVDVTVVNREAPEWQVARYRYASDTLTFVRRIDSPSGAPVNFSAGIKDVYAGPIVDPTDPVCAAAIDDGTLTLDPSIWNFFQVAVDADITEITISESSKGTSFMIEFTANGTAHEQAWPWTWLTGTPVLSTTAGKRDLAVVWTVDGVAFFASLVAQYY